MIASYLFFLLAPFFVVVSSAAALHSCGGAYEDVGGRTLSAFPGLPPFSFQLGTSSSDDILSRSSSTSSTIALDADRNETVTVFYDVTTSLVTTVTVITYWNVSDSTSASEWFLTFTNNGSSVATPPLCAIYGVNMSFLDNSASSATEVRRYFGSDASSNDYAAINETLVTTGLPSSSSNYTWFYPANGRSSDTSALPFFSVFNAAVGFTFSVGWSGSWAAAVRRGDADGAGNASSVWIRHDSQNGDCPGVCAPLLPGESFRSMRILMVTFPASADNAASYHLGVNAHRRILARYKVPRGVGANGSGPVLGAITSSLGYFNLPNCPNASYASQLSLLQGIIASASVEAYWLDASWFNGCFPSGVGNWQLPLSAVVDQTEFPNASLANLSVLAHAAAPTPVKFILWVEPERVAEGTYIATAHSDFLIPTPSSNLINLGNATVRAYMTAFLAALVAELRLDFLRSDFNTAPGPNWVATDAPDRAGITQLAYIEGLYTMWDDIRAGAPGLLIDNCASGGRRIDLETLSRSVPLWRSDSASPGQPPEDQMVQTMGLSGFAPVHAGTTYSYEPYYWRSTGSVGQTTIDLPWPLLVANATEMALLQAAQAETRRLRALSIFGDYFPLTPIARNDSACTAWQHHCDGAQDCGEAVAGALHIFRGPAAQPVCTLLPFAIDAGATYDLDFYSSYELDHSSRMTGAEFASVSVNITAGYQTSLLLQYTCSAGCPSRGTKTAY